MQHLRESNPANNPHANPAYTLTPMAVLVLLTQQLPARVEPHYHVNRPTTFFHEPYLSLYQRKSQLSFSIEIATTVDERERPFLLEIFNRDGSYLCTALANKSNYHTTTVMVGYLIEG